MKEGVFQIKMTLFGKPTMFIHMLTLITVMNAIAFKHLRDRIFTRGELTHPTYNKMRF